MDSHIYHQLDDKDVLVNKQRKLNILKQRSNVVYLARSIHGTDNAFEVERRKTVTTITVNGVKHIVSLNAKCEFVFFAI